MNGVTDVYNPATGELLVSVRELTAQEVFTAAQDAKAAQFSWNAIGFEARKHYLLKMREYIVLNAETIANTIRICTGKTMVDALSTEVLPASLAFNYYAQNARRLLKPKRLFPSNIITANKRSVIYREPFGVVGLITPWNYPFGIPAHEVAMALITGNTVLLKTDAQTIPACEHFVRAAEYAGLPSGVFQFINVPVPLAGTAMVNSGINKLIFTGSVRVGKLLMAEAAEKLIPVSLELGGNDVMIVTSTADIERAVGGALWAGLSNSGQSCAGVEKILVHSSVYGSFSSLLKQRLSDLRIGDNSSYFSDIGSMTTERQINTVKRHLEDAVAKGASVFLGNSPLNTDGKGFFFQPVLLEGTTNDMEVEKEETFGPIITIRSFDTKESALEIANNSQYGLTASVWTKNSDEEKYFVTNLQAGQVTVNDHLFGHGLPEAPWGGYKLSGIGRTHGILGLEEMTQAKTVITDMLPFAKRNLWWYPHNEGVFTALMGGMNFLYHPSLSERVNGLIALLKKVPRMFTSWGK